MSGPRTPTSGEPRSIQDERELDELLSRPGESLGALLASLPGNFLILGAGGKMGPSLARMARRALDGAGATGRRVVAVSRFGGNAPSEQDRRTVSGLRDAGVETLRADLSSRAELADLPDAANIIYMAGQKFGTREQPALTWAMNCHVPSLCAERYAGARVVVFSTGNVYPLTTVRGPGASESTPPAPLGEYAMSCLGRERLWEYFARRDGTSVSIVRINYANALRYGVLTDIAWRVWTGEAVDVTMGAVNVIWQGDANRLALSALAIASNPPSTVNVTGMETLQVRAIAHALGERLGRTPVIAGREAPDALLANAARMGEVLGQPRVEVDTLLDWTADWVRSGRPLLGRPTHYERRDGSF